MLTTTNPISQPLRRRFGLAPAALAAMTALTLAACGGGDIDEKTDGTVATKNKAYTVGGNVGFSAAAEGSVTLLVTSLADGSTSEVTVANNSPEATPYTFDKAFIKNEGYSVSIVDAGSYQCIFTGDPVGEVDKADVTGVNLFCNVFVPPPSYSADFTVTGLPPETSLTAGYTNFFTGESATKTFTIGADGSTYSFDGVFFEATFLQFGVLNPAGYRCQVSTSGMIIESGVEATVSCTRVPTAN